MYILLYARHYKSLIMHALHTHTHTHTHITDGPFPVPGPVAEVAGSNTCDPPCAVQA